MQQLFSSGEILYKKNEKELPEGLLVGTSIEYDDVKVDTRFICHGTLQGKDVDVVFTISDDDYGDVSRRFTFKILMASDILSSTWKSYSFSFLR